MCRWFVVPVLAVALAACGGDGDGDGSSIDVGSTTAPATTEPATTVPETTSPETTTTTSTTLVGLSSSSASSTTEPEPTTTPATTATPTTAPPTTAPPTTAAAPTANCLVGEWVITEGEMNAFYDTLESQMEVPVNFTIVGQTGLDFTPDTYEYTANFDLILDAAGVGGKGASTGTVSGNYVVDDGVIVTTLGSSNLNLMVTVGGQTVDGSSMANGLLTSVPINDAPFTCENGVPVLMFKTADEGVLHPVRLTPA